MVYSSIIQSGGGQPIGAPPAAGAGPRPAPTQVHAPGYQRSSLSNSFTAPPTSSSPPRPDNGSPNQHPPVPRPPLHGPVSPSLQGPAAVSPHQTDATYFGGSGVAGGSSGAVHQPNGFGPAPAVASLDAMASRPQPAHRRTHSNTSNGAPSIHRRPSGGSDHSRTRSMGRESSRGGGAARQDASTSRPLHTEGDPLPYEWSSTYLLSMRDTLMKSMNTMARHGGFRESREPWTTSLTPGVRAYFRGR